MQCIKPPQIQNENMKDRMLKFIALNPTCTFSDIERYLGDEMSGNLVIHLPEHPNIYIWAYVNHEFIETYYELIKEKKIEVEVFTVFYGSPVLFMVYGGALDLPFVNIKSKRIRSYKNPHWLPMCFKLTEEEARKHKEWLKEYHRKAMEERYVYGNENMIIGDSEVTIHCFGKDIRKKTREIAEKAENNTLIIGR